MPEHVTWEELRCHCNTRHDASEKRIDEFRADTKESLSVLFSKIDSINKLLLGVLCSVVIGVIVQVFVMKAQPVPVEIKIQREDIAK